MVKKYDKKSNKENNIDNNYLFNIQDRPIKSFIPSNIYYVGNS